MRAVGRSTWQLPCRRHTTRTLSIKRSVLAVSYMDEARMSSCSAMQTFRGVFRIPSMGLSLSLDNRVVDGPDAQAQTRKTLDAFSDPHSLAFVFVRACRWCVVALVLQLVISRLWFNPVAEDRSTWLPAYPIQIFGVALALLLAVRCGSRAKQLLQAPRDFQATCILRPSTASCKHYCESGLICA